MSPRNALDPVNEQGPGVFLGQQLVDGTLGSPSQAVLVEVCGVLLREIRLVGRELVDGEDGIRRADRDAVAAVDALVGIDKQLGHRVCAGLIAHGMDRGGSTLRRTQKILLTRIGNYIRHGLARFQWMG